jgi:hypothetical protein
VRKADNFTAICEPIVWKMWESRRLTILWASTACYRDSFTFLTNTSIQHSICFVLRYMFPHKLPSHLQVAQYLKTSVFESFYLFSAELGHLYIQSHFECVANLDISQE